MLARFHEQLLCFQERIRESRRHLESHLTSDLEQAIDHYVEQYGLALPRIINEGYIAAIEYNYMDRIIEEEFEVERPHPEHV